MFTRPVLALLAISALLAGACTNGSGTTSAAAQVASPQGVDRGVSVAGVGRVSGRPDTLRATVGVSVRRDTVQAALDQANASAQAVMTALRDGGVAADDIQTRDFSVNPEYGDSRTGPPPIVGYSVTNLVEAKLRDLDRIGDILSAVVSVAGDDARVQQVGFFLEDNTALLAQAREQAFADARAKAEQYASLAGRSLGDVVSVSESTGQQPPPMAFDERSFAQDAASVPIAPGTSEVSVTVTAVWALG